MADSAGSGHQTTGGSQGGSDYRTVDLEAGLTPTQAQKDQINNINTALYDVGKGIYASGDPEAINDYKTAKLLYAPKFMAQKNAQSTDGVGAVARGGGNAIYFADSPYWTYARTDADSYYSASRLGMSGRASRAWTVAHEFGHNHALYIPVAGNRLSTENRANEFARRMTPFIRAETGLSIRVIYGP